MSTSEPAFVLNDRTACSACYGRKAKSSRLVWLSGTITGLAVLLLVCCFCIKSRSKMAIPTASKPLPAVASTRPSAHDWLDNEIFNPKSLEGVDCVYTGYDNPEMALPVLGEEATVTLRNMQRVRIERVLRDPTPPYQYRNGVGYKLYLSAATAPGKVLVLYPYGGLGPVKEKSDWYDVQLCRLSDYKLAVSIWQGKHFAFKGTRIGDIEVQPGTIIKVREVVPTSLHDFTLMVTLPSGAKTYHVVHLEDWKASLKPID